MFCCFNGGRGSAAEEDISLREQAPQPRSSAPPAVPPVSSEPVIVASQKELEVNGASGVEPSSSGVVSAKAGPSPDGGMRPQSISAELVGSSPAMGEATESGQLTPDQEPSPNSMGPSVATLRNLPPGPLIDVVGRFEQTFNRPMRSNTSGLDSPGTAHNHSPAHLVQPDHIMRTSGSSTPSTIQEPQTAQVDNSAADVLTVAALSQEIQDLAYIGQGASGDVYRGVWQGATVAVKYIVCQNADAQEAAANEAALGRLLAHPNVVQTYSFKSVVLDEEFYGELHRLIDLALRQPPAPLALPDDFQILDQAALMHMHLAAHESGQQNGSHMLSNAPQAMQPPPHAHSLPGPPGHPQGSPPAASAPVGTTGQGGSCCSYGMLCTQSTKTSDQEGDAGLITACTLVLDQAQQQGGLYVSKPEIAFSPAEDFSHPGQPQSILALQEVLMRADAKLGYQLTQIVMEHCDKGSLLQAIKRGLFMPTSKWGPRLALRALLRTAQEVAQGMWHIHQANVIHGDLKPGNVLLKSSRADRRGFVAKVSDFGLSLMSEHTAKDSKHWGTVQYMAPETFDGTLARQSDVYSYGVTLWQMVSGEKPWEDLHPGQIIVGVQSGSLTLDWPSHTHPRLARLGQYCLEHDRKKRPPFNYIMRELSQIENLVRMESSGAAPIHVLQPRLSQDGLTPGGARGSNNQGAGSSPLANPTYPGCAPSMPPLAMFPGPSGVLHQTCPNGLSISLLPPSVPLVAPAGPNSAPLVDETRCKMPPAPPMPSNNSPLGMRPSSANPMHVAGSALRSGCELLSPLGVQTSSANPMQTSQGAGSAVESCYEPAHLSVESRPALGPEPQLPLNCGLDAAWQQAQLAQIQQQAQQEAQQAQQLACDGKACSGSCSRPDHIKHTSPGLTTTLGAYLDTLAAHEVPPVKQVQSEVLCSSSTGIEAPAVGDDDCNAVLVSSVGKSMNRTGQLATWLVKGPGSDQSVGRSQVTSASDSGSAGQTGHRPSSTPDSVWGLVGKEGRPF